MRSPLLPRREAKKVFEYDKYILTIIIHFRPLIRIEDIFQGEDGELKMLPSSQKFNIVKAIDMDPANRLFIPAFGTFFQRSTIFSCRCSPS